MERPIDEQEESRIVNARRFIFEMIEASIQLALEKGPHPLKAGCSCIMCADRRKRLLAAPPKPWRYHL